MNKDVQCYGKRSAFFASQCIHVNVILGGLTAKKKHGITGGNEVKLVTDNDGMEIEDDAVLRRVLSEYRTSKLMLLRHGETWKPEGRPIFECAARRQSAVCYSNMIVCIVWKIKLFSGYVVARCLSVRLSITCRYCVGYPHYSRFLRTKRYGNIPTVGLSS